MKTRFRNPHDGSYRPHSQTHKGWAEKKGKYLREIAEEELRNYYEEE